MDYKSIILSVMVAMMVFIPMISSLQSRVTRLEENQTMIVAIMIQNAATQPTTEPATQK
jgi:hypothetical protein